MDRRHFLATSGAAAVAPLSAMADPKDARQYYELIIYQTHVGPRRSRVAEFYCNVALPAYGRLGIGPVGIFSVQYGPTAPSLYVLIAHDTLESVFMAAGRLQQDAVYVRDGAAFLRAPLDDPAYVRMERQLFVAFKDMPSLEVPGEALGPQRIFEYRVYESHSVRAHQKKIDMFNEGGEIALFRKTGLTPVFFGEALMGPSLPNLTYMLVFENMADRDAAWQRFFDDPAWHALRDDPQYADTVSNISDIILRPIPCSGI